MAQIGTFTRNEDGSFAGTIKTLNLNIKARLIVAEKDSDKSPDLRALAGTIEIGAGEEPEGWWIRVQDTGPGLPERAREHLFQPFSGGVKKGGTGLGLAI